ncbi:MAG: phosphoglucosamine mutase [Halothermotrichaceae bacterium]
MGELFGTDGVRGVANKELTGEIAYKVGRAGGYYLISDYEGEEKPIMLIGKDTRLSGDLLESALVAGMTSVGINVIKLGIIPTPGVSYLTGKLDVQGGIMISASHNPIADNGIKLFDSNGFKLSDESEDEIEDLNFNKYDELPFPTHTDIGNAEQDEKLVNSYIDYLISTVEGDFKGLKVVLDCANGAAYEVAPTVLEKLGAELIVVNNHPVGHKINLNCGSTHPEVIQELVDQHQADLGISHDGDADRIIMVDEKGNLVDGDKIMAVMSLNLLEENKLEEKTLVTTAYSNLGLKEVIEKSGGKLTIAANGDRYVLQRMLQNGYNLGGEKSGHIIYLDYNNTGDGVLTAIQMIAIVKKSGKKLSQLASVMKPWPQRLANVEVVYKGQLESNRKISDMIEKAEKKLGDDGRVFVRASGTEPVIRVMLEGKNEELLEEIENKLVSIIKKELN